MLVPLRPRREGGLTRGAHGQVVHPLQVVLEVRLLVEPVPTQRAREPPAPVGHGVVLQPRRGQEPEAAQLTHKRHPVTVHSRQMLFQDVWRVSEGAVGALR